jgi:hypothetical protein
MTIGELLSRLEKESMTMTEISDSLGLHRKTIQRKLKKLGYEYNREKQTWEWPGKEEDQPLNVNVRDLISNKAIDTIPKETAAAVDPNPDPNDDGPDVFDHLLKNKPKKNHKLQRGFYFEPDIIDALDKHVPNKNKSSFVNAAVKQVLKAKGLLK